MKKSVLFFFIFLILPQISSAYNAPTTHAGITEQIVEFFNLNNQLKLDSADREALILGSIDEDDPAVRALNHFFDPVQGMGINNYQTAIDWAMGENKGNEFSWTENIRKYAEGDREGALVGLGHILHLAEDMTVPDHTRNDAHIGEGPAGLGTGESVYEMWAKKYKDRQAMWGTASYYKSLGLRPREMASIKDYFFNISAYSNNNYVSADTIDDSFYQYSSPEVVEKRNGYAYGDDSYFYDRHKLFIDVVNKRGEEIKSLTNINNGINDLSVLEEYFPRLVKMAILSGTGIVQLFLTEAENARAEYLEAEKQAQEKITLQEAERAENLNNGGFLSQLWYRVSYAVSDASLAVVNILGDTIGGLGSGIYKGTSLAINSTKNTVNAVTYTTNKLATVGAERAQKIIVSTGQKVILYVKENAPKYITPAVAYNPPVQNPAHTLSDTEFANLLSALTASDPSTESDTESEDEDISVHHHSSGHSDPAPEIIDPVSTSTATSSDDTVVIVDDPDEDVGTTTATSTTLFEAVASPTVLSAVDIGLSVPTTTILFSGTSTPDFIISEDFTFTSTTTDAFGEWSLVVEGIPQGTTTLNFFAEPDILHASSTAVDPVTSFATTTNYIKSAPTESLVYVSFEDEVLNIDVPEPPACQNSLLPNDCLITTTELEMSWLSNSSKLDHYKIIINDDPDSTLETTATSSILELENENENTIEIFAVDAEGNESDHVIYQIIVYTYPVVINEVAWMGTSASTDDEWLELYNRTPYDIDLSRWILISADGIPYISLSGEIVGEGYYLLERTADTIVSDMPADLIYTGALGNGGEELILSFASTTIDQTPVGAWPAGNNTSKASMERRDAWQSGAEAGSWITNPDYFCNGSDALGGYIRGTPGMPNSSTYPPAPM